MRRTTTIWSIWLILILLMFPATVTAEQDVEGSKDHPLFTRLPNYFIDRYEVNEFDVHDKFVDSNGAYKTVEGRKFYINYYFKEGTKYLSEAQIKGNYREAFKKIGGVVHYEDRYNLHMSLDKGGKVTWVQVSPWNGGQGIGLTIVEEKAMEQYLVADADSLATNADPRPADADAQAGAVRWWKHAAKAHGGACGEQPAAQHEFRLWYPSAHGPQRSRGNGDVPDQ